jgi:hypothetical protein
MANLHGCALNDSWDDTNGELDPPSMMTGERDPNTVGDELTSSNSDRLDGDHCSSESSWSQLTDVYRGDSCSGTDASMVSEVVRDLILTYQDQG